MIRHYFRQLKKNERGATMVEFALVALLLFTLIFGIIEFGWIFNGYITLTSAVREGARQAIVSVKKDVSAEAVIKDVVDSHAILFNLTSADIKVTFGAYEEETTVEIIGFQIPRLIGFIPIPDSVYLINTKATMRQER